MTAEHGDYISVKFEDELRETGEPHYEMRWSQKAALTAVQGP